MDWNDWMEYQTEHWTFNIQHTVDCHFKRSYFSSLFLLISYCSMLNAQCGWVSIVKSECSTKSYSTQFGFFPFLKRKYAECGCKCIIECQWLYLCAIVQCTPKCTIISKYYFLLFIKAKKKKRKKQNEWTNQNCYQTKRYQ